MEEIEIKLFECFSPVHFEGFTDNSKISNSSNRLRYYDLIHSTEEEAINNFKKLHLCFSHFENNIKFENKFVYGKAKIVIFSSTVEDYLFAIKDQDPDIKVKVITHYDKWIELCTEKQWNDGGWS